jgi:hypothetical protein
MSSFPVITTEEQVQDAAEGFRHEDEERPRPLGQTLHGRSAHEIDEAVDTEPNREDKKDEWRERGPRNGEHEPKLGPAMTEP